MIITVCYIVTHVCVLVALDLSVSLSVCLSESVSLCYSVLYFGGPVAMLLSLFTLTFSICLSLSPSVSLTLRDRCLDIRASVRLRCSYCLWHYCILPYLCQCVYLCLHLRLIPVKHA